MWDVQFNKRESCDYPSAVTAPFKFLAVKELGHNGIPVEHSPVKLIYGLKCVSF
jgi:hypothetical protein